MTDRNPAPEKVAALAADPSREVRSALLDEWMRTGEWPPSSMAPKGGWTPPRLVRAIQNEVAADYDVARIEEGERSMPPSFVDTVAKTLRDSWADGDNISRWSQAEAVVAVARSAFEKAVIEALPSIDEQGNAASDVADGMADFLFGPDAALAASDDAVRP